MGISGNAQCSGVQSRGVSIACPNPKINATRSKHVVHYGHALCTDSLYLLKDQSEKLKHSQVRPPCEYAV